MRSIQISGDASSVECRVWSSPSPPKVHPMNFFHWRQALDGSRLDYLRFDKHVQGLLVCCSHALNLLIHAFSNTSKEFRKFVDLMHQCPGTYDRVWIYFPLNEREYIKAAWVRTPEDSSEQPSVPVLVVNSFSPHYFFRLSPISCKPP